MTALFVLAGIGTLLVLLAMAGRLRSVLVLLPGAAAASLAVLAASWLPAPGGSWWVSALVPIASVLGFVLVVGQFRRPGRSTSRSRR